MASIPTATAGSVLTAAYVNLIGSAVNSLLPGGNQVQCKAAKFATQSLTNVTFTKVSMPSEYGDAQGFHDTAVNNSRLTVPAGLAGCYLWGYQLVFAAGGAAGYRTAFLDFNNDGVRRAWQGQVSNGNVTLAACEVINANAGDYVELNAYQDSGGALNCGDAVQGSLLWCVRLGPL